MSLLIFSCYFFNMIYVHLFIYSIRIRQGYFCIRTNNCIPSIYNRKSYIRLALTKLHSLSGVRVLLYMHYVYVRTRTWTSKKPAQYGKSGNLRIAVYANIVHIRKKALCKWEMALSARPNSRTTLWRVKLRAILHYFAFVCLHMSDLVFSLIKTVL